MSDLSFYDLTYEGPVVQAILDTAQKLRTEGYIFMGAGTPSTVPGTPTQRVWYLCGPGTYANFGTSVTVPEGSVMVAQYASGWTTTVIEIASGEESAFANGNADLDITDENGNVLARFDGGDFEVKNFATKIFAFLDSVPDFAISDTNGKMLVEVKNGNVFTKNFSSAPLYGKKVSFLGDSITTFSSFQGSNNPYYTGSNAGVTNVDMTWWKMLVNGQGGIFNRIYAYGGGDIINNLCLRYNYLSNHGTYGIEPDVIFILGGINDWYHNKTLGAISDAENSNTTFFAAYKYLLKNIKVTYPNATIIGLTPLNSMIDGTTIPYVNSNGVSIRQFCDAVIACCDYYSVLSVDLNKLVNINGGNYTTYLDDNTHPNYQGMIKVAKAISLNIINKII